jgi:hypothetical protein
MRFPEHDSKASAQARAVASCLGRIVREEYKVWGETPALFTFAVDGGRGFHHVLAGCDRELARIAYLEPGADLLETPKPTIARLQLSVREEHLDAGMIYARALLFAPPKSGEQDIPAHLLRPTPPGVAWSCDTFLAADDVEGIGEHFVVGAHLEEIGLRENVMLAMIRKREPALITTPHPDAHRSDYHVAVALVRRVRRYYRLRDLKAPEQIIANEVAMVGRLTKPAWLEWPADCVDAAAELRA